MKLKQVTNLLAHVKNRFAPTQSPALKQAAGLTVQSGLKAGAKIPIELTMPPFGTPAKRAS